MAIFFTSPTFARAGVVAGFRIEAPLAGTPPSGNLSIAFYSSNTTVNGQALTISTGFVHWIQIGDLVYSYAQQSGDTASSVATALAALINSTPDPNATATPSGGSVVLAPRQDTDATVTVQASEAYQSQGVLQTAVLVELTGNNLIPNLTRGVLFAQGQVYRPALAPVVPQAPGSQHSWLFYSSTAGFYWSATSTPTVSDDAYIGWVRTNGAQIVAFSSRRIGDGEEAVVPTGSPLLISGAGGDTGVPPALSFGATVAPNSGQVVIGNLVFANSNNVEGVISATFLLYFIDQTVTPLELASPGLTAGGTSITANGPLPAPGPAPVVFTFLISGVVGGVTIAAGYRHNIAIGTQVYEYTQQAGDTAANVAAALAAAINANLDPNATATASGATVTLNPLRNDASVVPCTASDGNTPANMTEQGPTYLLIGNPSGNSLNGEIVEITAAAGSTGTIVRGQKGTTAQAWPSTTNVYTITEATSFFALPGAAYGTSGWPTALSPIPVGTKSLVAFDGWATNEYGNSAVTTLLLFVAPSGGGSGYIPPAAQVSGLTALNTGGYVNGIYYSMDASGGLCASIGVTWSTSTDPNWASEEILFSLDGTHFAPLGSAGGNTFTSAPMPCPLSGNYTVQAVSVNKAGVANSASIPTVTVNVNTSLASLVCLLPLTVGVTRTIEGITPGAPNVGTYNPSQQTATYSVAASFPTDSNRAGASVIFGVFNSNFQTLTPGPGTQGYLTSGPCTGWAVYASLGAVGVNSLVFTPQPESLGPSPSYMAFTVVPCNWGDQYTVMPAMPSYTAAFGASSFSYAMVSITGAVVTRLSGPVFSAAMNGLTYLLNGYLVTVAAGGYNSGNGTITLSATPSAGNLSNLSTGIPLQDVGLVTLLVGPPTPPLAPTAIQVTRTIEGITSIVAITNALTSSGSAVLNFASTWGIGLGQTASGTGVAAGSLVIAITPTTVTLSLPTTGVSNATTITFTAPAIGTYNALAQTVDYNVGCTLPVDPNRAGASVLFSIWNYNFQTMTPGPGSQGYVTSGLWAGWGVYASAGAPAQITSPSFVCAPEALGVIRGYMAFAVVPADDNGNYNTPESMPSFSAAFGASSFSYAIVSTGSGAVAATSGAPFSSAMVGKSYLLNGWKVTVSAYTDATHITLSATPTTGELSGLATGLPFQDIGLITLLASPTSGRIMTEQSVVAGTLTNASLSSSAGITAGQIASVAFSTLTGTGYGTFSGVGGFAGTDGSYTLFNGAGIAVSSPSGTQQVIIMTTPTAAVLIRSNGTAGPTAYFGTAGVMVAQAWNYASSIPAGPAMVLTATALTFSAAWDGSGNPTGPYSQVNASGFSVVNGSYSMTVGAASVALAYGSTSTLTLGSLSIVLKTGGLTWTLDSTGFYTTNVTIGQNAGNIGSSTYGSFEYYSTGAEIIANDASVYVSAVGNTYQGVWLDAAANSIIQSNLSSSYFAGSAQICALAGYGTAVGGTLESLTANSWMASMNSVAVNVTPGGIALGAPAAVLSTSSGSSSSTALNFAASAFTAPLGVAAGSGSTTLQFAAAMFGKILAGMAVFITGAYSADITYGTTVLRVYLSGSYLNVVLSAATTTGTIPVNTQITFSPVVPGAFIFGAGITLGTTVSTAAGSITATTVTMSAAMTVGSGVPITFVPATTTPIIIGGVEQHLAMQAAGAVTPSLGTNWPTGTGSAPYEFEKCIAHDGTHCVRPMWAMAW